MTFAYDPFGRRIKKVTSTTTSVFAYDGDNLIEETNSSGGVVARYSQTQNIDEPLAMLRSAATSYYHADGLGSITSLSNAAGSIANTYNYDSFGKLTASTGSLVNPFQYSAREFDTETGLLFLRNRYYDPITGRFLSEDPVGLAGGDVDLYAYVWNDPTTLVDPLGLQGGPWHPPAGVPTKCRPTDDCPTITGKIWILQRMIVSVTGWDWNVPSPRGGGRHSLPKDPNNPNNNDIGQLWSQLAECQALFAAKCTNCPPPVDVPAWKRFWQRNRTPILVTGAVVAGVAAVALAPVTGGQSLWGLAWAF